MKILSLFDGMSCGQIALERVGFKVDKYYASEIDKWAIQVTKKNYPDTIQLGDITNWREWDIEQPDIIMGGSPCQGFSFAGKQLNFEDERSKLFFVFVEILKHYKPKYFLLENVVMKQEHIDVISGILGELYPKCVTQHEIFRKGRLEPIMIKSALVSAQSRRRLYWTNIQGIEQPEDKGIMLDDIIQDNGEGVIKQDGKLISKPDKAQCLDANYFKGIDNHGQRSGKIYSVTIGNSKKFSGESDCGKAYIIIKNHCHGYKIDDGKPKMFSQIECERLQTVPDNYTAGVSNSQRYKMLGNGWTVDVIAHIFKYMKD